MIESDRSERAGSPMKAESPLPADDNKEMVKKDSDLTTEEQHSDDELEKVCLSVCRLDVCLSVCCLDVCLSLCLSVCWLRT